MSGRSAVVRKKNSETKTKKTGRPPSTASDEVPNFPLPPAPSGMAMSPTSAHFSNYPAQMMPQMDPRYAAAQGWGNTMPGVPMMMDPRYMGGQPGYPPADWGHGRTRKTSIKEEEEVSGIEKSGLRSMLDKKSDGVRRGLAKTFAFRKKESQDETSQEKPGSSDRPPSVATVRPATMPEEAKAYNRSIPPIQTGPPPIPYQYQQQPLPSPPSPMNPWDSKPIGPPPTSKLPPIPQTPGSSLPTMKRWMGAGRPVAKWNKLRKDPELWDPNGDVLVFLGRKGQAPRRPPSFRLSSHIIEATESRHLITLLREGSNEEDMYLPPSPAGYGSHLGPGRDGPLTPPISEDAGSRDELDGQISYELYFPPPANLSRVEQLRHQITTRNVFAVLYHASLVGTSLYQALSDLHTRLDSYMPHDNDNVAQVIKYLQVRGIDDVRGDAAAAVALLAWAESQDVRWEAGWRECFTHCAGMHAQLEACPDYKFTTPITRALLERASLETQLRVQAAEDRLGEFSYGDMWNAAGVAASGAARGAADRLQEMLQTHYTQVYGSWPPPPPSSGPGSSPGSGGEDMWLTRTVAMALQKDFGALYDYLVDRDVVWDVSEARSGRKWMMASESGNGAFEADSEDVPMTDMLIEFDNKLRFPHIPHPFPLIPESIPPVVAPTMGSSSSSSRLFKSKKAEPSISSGSSGHNSRSGAMERHVQLAYTESTNIYELGSDLVQSDLVDAYVRLEKSDRIGEVDPAEARRGRWVLIYGILQTLASVSVDDALVRHTDGVSYHLGPRLKGTNTLPPWKRSARKGSAAGGMGSGAHERSYCWTAAQRWAAGGHGESGRSEGEFDEDDYDDDLAEYFEESDVTGGRRSKMGFLRPETAVLSGRASVSSGGSGQTRRSGRDREGKSRMGRATEAGYGHGTGTGAKARQSIESFITAL